MTLFERAKEIAEDNNLDVIVMDLRQVENSNTLEITNPAHISHLQNPMIYVHSTGNINWFYWYYKLSISKSVRVDVLATNTNKDVLLWENALLVNISEAEVSFYPNKKTESEAEVITISFDRIITIQEVNQ